MAAKQPFEQLVRESIAAEVAVSPELVTVRSLSMFSQGRFAAIFTVTVLNRKTKKVSNYFGIALLKANLSQIEIIAADRPLKQRYDAAQLRAANA